MPVTLNSLIRQPSLGLTVLAGLAGTRSLDREISWVHTSELIDPTPYLQGGELLLSVGMWLGRDSGGADVSAYVERLVRAGVVGLGFGVGLMHDVTPRPLVKAAAARGLPLVEVPEQTPFITISRLVWEALAADQYAEVTRTFQAQQE